MDELFILYANARPHQLGQTYYEIAKNIGEINRKAFFDAAEYSEGEYIEWRKKYLEPFLSGKDWNDDEGVYVSWEDFSDGSECGIPFSSDSLLKYALSIFQKVNNLINDDALYGQAFDQCVVRRANYINPKPDQNMLGLEKYCIALEAVHYSLIAGCNKCFFNASGERRYLLRDYSPQITCDQCCHSAFKETLSDIIAGANFCDIPELYNNLRELKDAITITTTTLGRKAGFKKISWIDVEFLRSGESSFADTQIFNRFILGCVSFSLIEFIMSNSKNRKKIKKCARCNKYFISSKADPRQKKCKKCSGKRTTAEARDAQYKYRKNQKMLKENEKFRENVKRFEAHYSDEEIIKMRKMGEYEIEFQSFVGLEK